MIEENLSVCWYFIHNCIVAIYCLDVISSEKVNCIAMMLTLSQRRYEPVINKNITDYCKKVPSNCQVFYHFRKQMNLPLLEMIENLTVWLHFSHLFCYSILFKRDRNLYFGAKGISRFSKVFFCFTATLE